jgi:hypothetical protein
MTRPMIQLIPIMKIISNTCNTMLFCNYVLFILHLFLSTSCLSVLMGLLFLIAGDWTKMVGGSQRRVQLVYQRPRPGAPAADEEPSERPHTRKSNRRMRDSSSPASSPEGGGDAQGQGGVRSVDEWRGGGDNRAFHFIWFIERLLARSREPPSASDTSSSMPANSTQGG